MTIQSQLDQVLALAEKATPGPWRVKTSGNIGNQIEAQSGKSMWGGDDGMRSVVGYQYCGPSDNYIEQQEVTAATGELIAAAVNFLREHGPAIRAAVGGEAVVRRELIDSIQSQISAIAPPEKMTETRAEYWKAGARACIAAVNVALTVSASPPATVDVGALAELVEKWRTRTPANAGDSARVIMRESCADELAALIGKEA